MRKSQLLAMVLGSFLMGITVCSFGARALGALFSHERTEAMRITSPDGQFDAVMVQDSAGGAAGGIEWYVYIVGKGQAVNYSHSSFPTYVFQGSSLRGEKLLWGQSHLLEIQYDKAGIEYFRNLWGQYEIANVGAEAFLIEIRLAPTTWDFSLLTPAGQYR